MIKTFKNTFENLVGNFFQSISRSGIWSIGIQSILKWNDSGSKKIGQSPFWLNSKGVVSVKVDLKAILSIQNLVNTVPTKKVWKISSFFEATGYHRLQQICSIVWTSLYIDGIGREENNWLLGSWCLVTEK